MPAWTRGSAVSFLAAALGVALQYESLSFGLFGDDYFHMVAVANRLAGVRLPGHWWDIFGVPLEPGSLPLAAIEAGTAPWWVSSQFSLAFFRPLTAALHFADYALWPTSAFLMHAHNLAWYALLVVLVGFAHRRILGVGWAALLATTFYAVDEAHAEGAAWIAGRNTLVSACCCAAALLVHASSARDGSRTKTWGVALLVGAGLLAGEGGIAAWGLLLSHAVVLDRRAPRERARSLLPALLVTAMWAALHRSLGYGVHGSGVYLDPLGNPVELITALPRRFMILWLELFTLPASLYDALPEAALRPVRAASLLLAATLTALFLARARRDRATAFWLLAVVLCALPFCSALSPARLVFTPSIASSALLGTVAAPLLQRASQSLRRPRSTRALAALCFALHGVSAAVFCPLKIGQLKGLDHELRVLAASLPVAADARNKVVFLLNTPIHLATSTTLYLRDPSLPPLAGFFGFGSSLHTVVVSRPSPDVLELAPSQGYLLELTSLLVRSAREPFSVDERFQVGPAQVRVAALTPDGRPARIVVELPRLDDPDYVWVQWAGGSAPYRTVELPPVGASILLTPLPQRPRAEEQVWL